MRSSLKIDSNEFYREWLDPSMTYSSALYSTGANDLQSAQNAKYRALAEATGIRAGDHVLEIGCGWGGFAEFAAGELNCKVTGLTISREQFAYAEARIEKAGLGDRVGFRFQDYRDEAGLYDRIVSIEMFEAVGEKYWRFYFSKLRQCLKPGGKAGLQIITIRPEAFDQYRSNPDSHSEICLSRRHAADARPPGRARRQGRSITGQGLQLRARLRPYACRMARALPVVLGTHPSDGLRRAFHKRALGILSVLLRSRFPARNIDVRQVVFWRS